MAMINNRAICVLGMHRSGTSAVTKFISLLGAYIGEPSVLMPADGENSEGYWEHRAVVDFHERLLDFLGRSWHDTQPLPDRWWKDTGINGFKAELVELLCSQFSNCELWAWKDPRTCLFLPLWQDVLDQLGVDVSYFICLRNPLDVAASLQRRDGFSHLKSLLLWEYYNLSALYWSGGSKRIIASYDRLMALGACYAKEIVWELSAISLSDTSTLDKALEQAFKPNLRHHYTSMEAALSKSTVPNTVKALYSLLAEADINRKSLNSQEVSATVNKLYDGYVTYASSIFPVAWERKIKTGSFQVFWDEGNGYSEENSLSYKVICDGTVRGYQFVLPCDRISGPLRLDPINSVGYIEIVSIILQNGNDVLWKADWTSMNNVSLGAGLIRLEPNRDALAVISVTDDPNLFIDCPLVGSRARFDNITLKIAMAVDNDPDRLARAALWWINKEANEYATKVNALANVYEDKIAFLQTKFINELRQLKDENKLMREELEERSRCSEQLLMELNQIKHEYDDLRNELADVTSKNDMLKVKMEEQQLRLEEVITSFSWRLTNPIRRIRRFQIDLGLAWRKSFFQLRHITIAQKLMRFWLNKSAKEERLSPVLPRVKEGGLVKRDGLRLTWRDQIVPDADFTVSVVIPTKNAGPEFEFLLRGLREQKGLNDLEVIVVDSGSKDETLAIAKSYGAKVIEIPPEDFSHSHSRNIGAENASGKYLFFTVQDALLPSSTFLFNLLQVKRSNPIVAVSCAEFPREDSDLFYDMLSWNHYRFLDVLDH
ncbi:MAG: glycosyltransferase, partial [Candidatus Methanomethyliaceae archaeon]